MAASNPCIRAATRLGKNAGVMVGRAASPGVAVVASAAVVLAALPGAGTLLTDVERRRAARLRKPAERQDFVAAHVLVRLCAEAMFGVDRESPVVQRCAQCGGEHGRPTLPAVSEAGLSLAHSGGVVAAAVASGRVGIDVEPLGGAAVVDAAPTFTTAAERRLVAAHSDPHRALLLLWVRKEALVKAGLASLDAMSSLDLADLPFERPGSGQHPMRYGDLTLLDLALPETAGLGAVASEQRLRVLTLEELMRATPTP